MRHLPLLFPCSFHIVNNSNCCVFSCGLYHVHQQVQSHIPSSRCFHLVPLHRIHFPCSRQYTKPDGEVMAGSASASHLQQVMTHSLVGAITVSALLPATSSYWLPVLAKQAQHRSPSYGCASPLLPPKASCRPGSHARQSRPCKNQERS